STARNANAKSVSLLRSKADRIACERTSSRNRNTVAASVSLCAGGRFWLRRFCANLMASTIMRSELIGTKTRRSQQRSNPGSLVFKTFGFNITQSFPSKFTSTTFWTVIFSGAGEIGRIDIPQRGSPLCASTGVLSSETARVHHADWWLGRVAERRLPVRPAYAPRWEALLRALDLTSSRRMLLVSHGSP